MGIGGDLHAEGSFAPTTTAQSGPDSARDAPPVVIISPQQDSEAQPKRNHILAEDEAYDLIWNLPEVRKEIEKILEEGGTPLATVVVRPDSGDDNDKNQGGNSFYAIRFQGLQANKVSIDRLFYVDALSGIVLVYDTFKGRAIPLDEWRRGN